MSKVTPDQKAKAEQYIKDNIGPKSYKNNAYGELSKACLKYDDFEIQSKNNNQLKDTILDINLLLNSVKDYVLKNTITSSRKQNNIYRRYEDIQKIKIDILEYLNGKNIDLSNDFKELDNAFDFELEPLRNEVKPNIVNQTMWDRLVKIETSTINNSQTEDSNNDYLEYKKLFEKDIPNAAFKELEKPEIGIPLRIAFLYITGDLERIYEDEANYNSSETFRKINIFTGGLFSNSNWISATLGKPTETNDKNLDHEKNRKHIQEAVKIAKKYKVEIHTKFNEY
jgi:hypothetical protein